MESETSTTTSERWELLSSTNTVHVVIFAVTIFSWLMLVIANIAFTIAFCVIVWKDSAFVNWTQYFKKSRIFIQLFGALITFKIDRLFYSRFFGLDIFSASFNKIKRVLILMMAFCIFNIFFSILPIIIVDIYALIKLSWGT